MKRISQYLMLTGLTGLLCLFLAVPANAQRNGGHGGGGGGGGYHGGGGGGGSHFSGGGGGQRGGFSGGRQGGASSGGGRATFGTSRQNIQGGGLQGNTRAFNNRSSVTGNTRAFNSYNNRVGVSGRVGVTNGYRGSSAVARGGFVTRGGRSFGGGYGGRSYGYRSSPWYNHGGYYFNRGFYRSSYYPRLGFSLGILPYGYYPFYWGDAQFYYSSGYFYQYNNDQYTVVEPPIGAAINTLPENAQSISINGQQYYELNGVYYQPITKDDGTVVYQVAGKDGQLDTNDSGSYSNDNGNGNMNNSGNNQAVASPEIGDIFYSLPQDTRKIKINGNLYYVSPDDFYYQESQDQAGKKVYKIVGTPDNTPGN